MALQKQDNYAYDSLEYGKDCVRLLEILPGNDEDKIECRFRQVPLSDEVPFTAISYVCGTAATSEWVELDDGRVAVRPNVVELLKSIRDTKETQTIWIDAVSIDSGNVKERNHQVQLMSKIYRAATSVLVWLGPEYDGCSTLFSLINCCTKRMEACDIVEYMQSLNKSDQDHLWKALEHVCLRNYWGRMWIVQEVLLAKRLSLRCGRAATDGAYFLNFLFEFVSANSTDRSFRALQNEIISCYAYRLLKRWQGQHGKRSGTLQDLIEEYGGSACTDTRDKVYALLGLAEDHQGKKIIVVNYSQPLSTLFLVVMAFAQPHSPLAFGQSLLRVLEVDTPNPGTYGTYSRSISYPLKVEEIIPLQYIEEELWGSLPSFFFSIRQKIAGKIVRRQISRDCGCLERQVIQRDFEDTPSGYSCVYAFGPRTAGDCIIHDAQLVIGRMPDDITYLVFIIIKWEENDENSYSNKGGIQIHSRCIAKLCPKSAENLNDLAFHSAGEFLDCTIDLKGTKTAQVKMSSLLLMRLMTFT